MLNTTDLDHCANRNPSSVDRHACASPNRILIDCTDTVQHGIRTGIQRVVRSLVREGVELGRERDQRITGVVLGESGFEPYCRNVDPESNDPPPTLRENALYYAPKAYVRSAEWLCRRMKSERVRRWLLPKPRHLGIFKPLVKTLELVRKVSSRGSRQASGLVLGQGDLLILADVAWNNLSIWDHIRAARANGTFVTTVIYDIIPLSHKQFVPPRLSADFQQYLRKAVTSSNLLVAISKTIRDELHEKLPEIFPDLNNFPQVEAFALGADFADKAEPVRTELIELYSQPDRPAPYLSVSTMEPRKNHGFTLKAMEALWSRGTEAGLVFVGKRGWMSDELLHEIENHPAFGKRLFWYQDLSDSELFYCYRRARGTISSSFVEGFNLPIVESLWHGRKTFASDTPVHREVGGEQVVYFGLTSPESLARAIAQWESELASGANVEQRQITPLNWRDSTELLLQKSSAAYARRNAADNPREGQSLSTPSGARAAHAA